MDFISDNLGFAVFIVIAIVLQIGRLVIRNAEKRRREAREEPAEFSGRERPGTAVYDKYEDDDGEFSAWDLSVDDEAEPVVPAAAPRPVSVSFPAPLSAPASGPFPALNAASALGTENREPERPSFPSMPEAGSSIKAQRKGQSRDRNKGQAKRAAGFPEKLDYLPPLKRAVVLAEILGAPKGF